jgi:hypothetical protein
MNPKYERLKARLKTLGIKLVIKPELDSSCPFSCDFDIDYKRKRLLFTGDLYKGDPEATMRVLGGLIHEAGHLVASLEKPRDSEEFNFLGWEFALAIELGLLPDLLAQHEFYMVDLEDMSEIKDLNEDRLSELIEERIDYARSIGLVIGDKAVAIR